MSGPAELLLQPEGVSIEEVAAVAAGETSDTTADFDSSVEEAQSGDRRSAESKSNAHPEAANPESPTQGQAEGQTEGQTECQTEGQAEGRR